MIGKALYSQHPYEGFSQASSLDDLKEWFSSLIFVNAERWIGVRDPIKKRDLNVASRFWFGFISNTIMASKNEYAMRIHKANYLGSIMHKKTIDLGLLTL